MPMASTLSSTTQASSSPLHDLFESSMSPLKDTRTHAELTLKTLSRQPGFASALLSLIQGSALQKPSVAVSGAIYFKNWVDKHWYQVDVEYETDEEKARMAAEASSSSSSSQFFYLHQIDREWVKENVLPMIVEVSSTPLVRSQLLQAFGKVLRVEYPKRWNTLPSTLAHLIHSSSTSSASSILASFLAFLEFVKWKSHGPEYERTVAPVYIQLFNTLIYPLTLQALQHVGSDLKSIWWSVVKAGLKLYFQAIRYRWNGPLMQSYSGEGGCSWMTLANEVITLVTNLLSSQSIDEDDEDSFSAIESEFAVKARKWALHLHSRVLQRFVLDQGEEATDSQSTRSNPGTQVYFSSQVYPRVCATSVLQTVLSNLVEPAISAKNHKKSYIILGPRAYGLVCDFLVLIVRYKPGWQMLGAHHVLTIVQQLLFPRSCWSSLVDDELWEDDTQECVKVRFIDALIAHRISDEEDGNEEGASSMVLMPAMSVTCLLDLVRCRKKHLLEPLLSSLAQRLDQGIKTHSWPQVEGSLFVLGAMAKLLISTNHVTLSHATQLLQGPILGILSQQSDSIPGYLRARCLWTMEQFLGSDRDGEAFADLSLPLLNVVLACLSGTDASSTHLAIRACAALTIGSLLDYVVVQEQVTPAIPTIVSSILQVSSEVLELDALSYVLEKIVGAYAQELTPYAEQVASHLVMSLLKLLDSEQETKKKHEPGASEDDDSDGLYFGATDRMMSAVGLLSAINGLAGGMSASPQILARLEPICQPLILTIIQRQCTDLYEEIFELMDTLTFISSTGGASSSGSTMSKKVSQGTSSAQTVIPSVSATMWQVFEATVWCLLQTTSGIDYLCDMATSLENFISNSARDGMPAAYLQAIVDVYTLVMSKAVQNGNSSNGSVNTVEESGVQDAPEADIVSVCKLAEALFLNQWQRMSRDQVKHILTLLGMCIGQRLLKDQRENPTSFTPITLEALLEGERATENEHKTGNGPYVSYRGGFHGLLGLVTCIELALNGFYRDPVLTMASLGSIAEPVMTIWLALAPKMLTRVHDRRLTILAITSLMTCISNGSFSLPDSCQDIWRRRALHVLLDAIQGYPAALASRDKQRKEFEEKEEESDSDDSNQFVDSDDYAELSDTEDKQQSSSSHVRFDKDEDEEGSESSSCYEDDEWAEDDEEPLGEEFYFETPFDLYDFMQISQESVKIMANSGLMQFIGPQEHQFLQNVLEGKVQMTLPSGAVDSSSGTVSK